MDGDRTANFHYAALSELSRHGLARLYGLALDGTLVGVYYGFHHKSSAYAYLGGFDPAAAYISPGALLIEHAITAAVREGAAVLNFLRGREAYKYRWGASDRLNACLWLAQAQLEVA